MSLVLEFEAPFEEPLQEIFWKYPLKYTAGRKSNERGALSA